MPIYQYSCEITGQVVEQILPLEFADYIEIDCPIHCRKSIEADGEGFKTHLEKTHPMHYAQKIWSLPGNIQIGSPTKIFINNKTGEIFTPFSRHDKPPNGYHEKELKSPIERSKFEKEQQRRADAENQLTSHVLDSMKSEARKNRHDNLKAKMNAVQREEIEGPDGKKETIEFTLDHKDKSLLNKAMQRSNKKPKKEKKTDVKFAINHYNPSNMDQVK